MPEFRLWGYVYLQRLNGNRETVPGCSVRHLWEDCCSEQEGGQGTDNAVTDADGSYGISFQSTRYTHTIRCDYAGAVATTRRFLSPNDVGFGLARKRRYNFTFQEAGQASIAHECSGICSTKEGPCERHTTNVQHCYQHTDQDTAPV